ncbi:hypothetical protein WMY93_019072 [Mugilogobius chulae]|uniref:Uncharacterized protein n=1 Tax=Mugilogobius chulae TaxID=88201 RepID=A0AAW0NQD5_9GOBI
MSQPLRAQCCSVSVRALQSHSHTNNTMSLMSLQLFLLALGLLVRGEDIWVTALLLWTPAGFFRRISLTQTPKAAAVDKGASVTLSSRWTEGCVLCCILGTLQCAQCAGHWTLGALAGLTGHKHAPLPPLLRGERQAAAPAVVAVLLQHRGAPALLPAHHTATAHLQPHAPV